MMENSPTISIIIPAYNAENYIKDCVASIQSQTYSDYEVIIVDDGSKDATAQICDELASNDSRVRVYHQPNGGAGAARKYGVSQAKGEWVMFVDSDDTITQKGLGLLMSLTDSETDMVCGAINLNGNLFAHQVEGVLDPMAYIEALLLVNTTDGPVAKLIRRRLFDDINWNTPREITQNEDMLMLVELATKMRNRIILTSDVVCYNYFLRGGSATSRTMPYDIWIKLFNELQLLLYPFLNKSDKVRSAFCEYRLKRLYNNLILRGEFVKKDKYIETLINDSKVLLLNNKAMNVISNPITQRLMYCKALLRSGISKSKKFLLRFV